MSTALKALVTKHQGALLYTAKRQSVRAVSLPSPQQQARLAHAGAIDPHRLRRTPQHKVVGCNKLLQAIRKGDQKAVWTQYMELQNQLGSLSPEYHSLTLRALGLKNLIVYGPDEIQAVKERLMMIWANMKHHGHTPDIRDYNHMLGFAGRSADWTLAERIWAELSKHQSHSSLWGLAPNVFTYNVYMLAAINTKQPEKVPSIFNTMHLQAGIQPNTSSYNILMDAYGHLGDIAEVDRLFDRVFVRQQRQQPAKRLGTLLHPARDISTALGRRIATLSRHATPVTKQHQPNSDTFLAMIDSHGRHGNISGVKMIHTKLMPEFNVEPTVATYNAMIRWFCHKSDISGARDLLQEMEARGIEPNIVTFNPVFRHEALKLKSPKKAERLLDLIQQAYELKPLQSMYRHLIRIHMRHNREDEVDRLVKSYEASLKPSSTH
jgi:pentatricopeptide repeat protein